MPSLHETTPKARAPKPNRRPDARYSRRSEPATALPNLLRQALARNPPAAAVPCPSELPAGFPAAPPSCTAPRRRWLHRAATPAGCTADPLRGAALSAGHLAVPLPAQIFATPRCPLHHAAGRPVCRAPSATT
uniref:Uncharacterized protein n=1 Tax=Arundo donax TaxID=35708 RepID=A0A0A8XZF0_ARUDO